MAVRKKKNDLVDCIKNETTTQKIDIDGAPDRSQGGACRILFRRKICVILLFCLVLNYYEIINEKFTEHRSPFKCKVKESNVLTITELLNALKIFIELSCVNVRIQTTAFASQINQSAKNTIELIAS